MASELGHLLFNYQKQWIANNHRYSIYLKSRRIGITWAEALWSVRRRLTHRIDHFFVSANLQTAQEFIRYIKQWAEVFNLSLSEEYIDLKTGTTQCLVMPNGSRIVAISSNPTALRGMGGDVSLDEFGFHENADELFKSAQPVTMWRNSCLRIISTQNGISTTFNKLVTKAEQGSKFKLYKTTLEDAVQQGFALRVPGEHRQFLPDIAKVNEAFIKDIKDTCLDEESYKQEYMCEVSNVSTVISSEDYDKCILKGHVVSNIMPKGATGPLYIGVDIGRSYNLTVIWVLEEGVDLKAPEHMRLAYRTIAKMELSNMPFQAQFQVLDEVAGHPSVMRMSIDAGGIGAQLAEDLYSKHGNRVEPFIFSNNSKVTVIGRMRKFISQARVSLPEDETTKADLLALKKTLTPSGQETFNGQSGASHCDRAMSLALALHAADSTTRFQIVGDKNGKNE